MPVVAIEIFVNREHGELHGTASKVFESSMQSNQELHKANACLLTINEVGVHGTCRLPRCDGVTFRVLRL